MSFKKTYLKFILFGGVLLIVLTFPIWGLLLGDGFANNLEIPKGVDFRKPLYLEDSKDMNKIDWSSLIEVPPKEIKFDLVDVPGNGGIYEYGVWYQAQEEGYLYIRVYEYTKNQELSRERLRKKSRTYVSPSNLHNFYRGRFTVYEGDWGDYYAARVELWFDPASEKQGFEILEHNYIIQGWMR